MTDPQPRRTYLEHASHNAASQQHPGLARRAGFVRKGVGAGRQALIAHDLPALVKGLLVGLRERGLDVTRPDPVRARRGEGARRRREGRLRPPPHPAVPTAQNLKHPGQSCPTPSPRSSSARCGPSTASPTLSRPRPPLEEVPRRLERQHPGAAASLREVLAETLTIIRLGVPPTLARTLRSTNPIESMIEICRDHCRNVKRWQDGTMVLRWSAAGMLEANKQFRRVNGHLHMKAPRAALDEHAAANVTPDRSAAEKEVA